MTVIYKASAESSSLAQSSNVKLPVWASWDWTNNYLPDDIHLNKKAFKAALVLLANYRFSDHEEGALIVLGFGLLLRECWRAIEVENDDDDDDDDIPTFVRNSLLNLERASQVTEAIKEVLGRLPSPSKEKESDSIGEKRPATKKCVAHTPFPIASTSKLSGTKKGDIPTKKIRSQRHRVPSKKVRDS
jgi:hypothetical protein